MNQMIFDDAKVQDLVKASASSPAGRRSVRASDVMRQRGTVDRQAKPRRTNAKDLRSS